MENQRLIEKIINQLKERTALQALSPKQIWRSDIDASIKELDCNGRSDDPSVIAFMAGLHLWNDNLYTSHDYCQQIEDDPTGAYWHALMHRMEQDYSNSKYWFYRAGNHPVKQVMPRKAAEYLQQFTEIETLGQAKMTIELKHFRDKQSWNSDDFVDLVHLQESGQGNEETRRILEGLQQLEFRALFDFTYETVFKN